MSKYHIVLMEDSEGNRQYSMTGNNETFLKEKSDLEALGYKVIQHHETDCKALYTKIRCEIYVSDLRELEKKRSTHLEELHRTYNEDNLQAIRDTEKVYDELEESLINKIGMSYSRFLLANEDELYDYKDELAVSCYNFRKSRIRLDNQIAKATYDGSYDC